MGHTMMVRWLQLGVVVGTVCACSGRPIVAPLQQPDAAGDDSGACAFPFISVCPGRPGCGICRASETLGGHRYLCPASGTFEDASCVTNCARCP